MRWLLLLIVVTGFAYSDPPTIFGQAGMPDPFELINVIISGYIDADSGNFDHLVVNVDINADVSVDSATADGTRHWDFTATATDDPAANAEVNSGYFAYDINGGSNGVFTVNGLEGVVRSRFADEAMTARGVYGRVYIDPDSTATIRTGIGGEFSARASYSGGTTIAAENGTAFVGARIWMAPYFSAGTVNNVNNFWGLWIYGEHASQRNADAAIAIEDAGGGWTYGVDMVDALISIAEIRGQNAETIDNATDGFWDLASDLILGRGTVGDEDISVYADTGGTPFEWFQYDEGGDRTDWITAIRYEGTVNMTTSPLTFAPPTFVLDWDNIAGGVGELGMADDTTRIPDDAFLDIDGGLFISATTYDSTATLASGVLWVTLDQAAGQDTLNLPAAASHTDRIVIIKCVNANGSVIDANSTELIDAAQTVALAQWDSISLFCDGARWLIW